MLVEGTHPTDPWGHPFNHDNQECENCGRSLMGRFGEQVLAAECPSCEADWMRELRAGHVTDGEGNVITISETQEAPAPGSDRVQGLNASDS